MIVPCTTILRCPASREIPARILSRLLFLFFLYTVLLSAFAAPAFAQYQTYPIYTDVSSIPAGSYGTTIVASVDDSSSTANFNVCFDTGYGSSKVPIVPYNYVSYGDFAQFSFNVPPATIQAVPPGAFTSGSFNVSIYSVPTKFTACNGNEGGAPQGNTVTLNYPVLNSVSLPYLPQQNAALTAREPSTLDLNGSNFISNSGTSGNVPSAVNFISSTTLAGTVKFLAGYLLRSTIPTTIPAGASSVNIQVCNTATYSYCSNSLTLKTVALQPDPGTLTATPSPAFTTQPVTLTATFGPATHSTAGAPSGPVIFGAWGATLGTANLVLDKTATFVQAPTQQFLVYATPIPPIVADFNGDGIPDTLFIDPGSANYDATLHLQLGNVPAGSFQADQQFYVQSDGPGFTISSAAIGDFNGDGIPDILLLATEPGYNSGLNLYTMLGNGDGTFQDGFSSSPTLYGSQIVAGDFNKDGKLDIAIAGALDANGTIGLQTLLGDSTGNFTAGPSTTGLRTAPSPYFGDFKVVAADFNGDGYPDIAVMNGYSPSGQLDNSIEVYQNNGTGAFLAPVRVQTDGTASANFSIAAIGPGLPPDIIVTSTASQYPGIDVALNQSTTSKIAFFGTLEGTQVPGFTQAVFGDFDGDGLLDAAVDDAKTIHVLSGNGLGAFTATYTDLSIVPPGTTLIAASDENGDKYADLLLYTTGGQNDSGQYPITLYDYVTAGTATATYPPTTFAAGTHMLHASTNGTFNILAGTANATLIVNTPPASTVTLTAAPPSPTSFGTALITLTATIAVTNATGSVAFYNGGTFLGNAPLVDSASSTATFPLAAPAAGSYSFKAVYAGDTTHGPGTSAVLPYVVNPATPSIQWTPNPSTIVYGTPLSSAQLDASATGIAGANLTGSFAYTPGLGTVLAAGNQPLCVTFTPNDANYAPANTCQTINVTQVRPSVAFTITSGGRAASSVASGSVVTLTAKVTVAGNPVNPGQVNFCDAAAAYCTDIHLLGTAQLTPAGTATLRFIPGIGSHGYKAVFLGTTNDSASTSMPLTLTVTGLYPTTTTIAQSGSVGDYTLTATVVGTGSVNFAPAGTVSFLDESNGNTVLGTGALGAGTEAIGFVNSATPAAGPGAYISLTGDLNGDGKPDVVVINEFSSSLTVLLGNGDGTFTAAASPAVGTLPLGGVLADFNGDGILDIAVANSGDNTVSILLGKGDGTFTAGTTASTGQIPGSVAAGDINGDGNIDLVVANQIDNDLTVLLGKGDGTFTEAEGPQTGEVPGAIAFGDFSGDGKLDMAVAVENAVNVFLGNGDGTFVRAPDTAVNSVYPASVAAGDVNKDGRLDLVVADEGDFGAAGAIYVLLGNGDGTFTAAASPSVGSRPVGAVLADLNGDGVPDISTVNLADNTASILLGKGDGTFTSIATLATGQIPVYIATADFNGDGRPDLVTANSAYFGTTSYGNGSATVFLTQLTQTATATATPVAPLGAGTHEVVASYQGDENYAKSVSAPTGLMGSTIAPIITWMPTPATISYGTALAASQLDATAASATGATIPGTFAYTPAAGTILAAGSQILKVVFTPTSSIYSVATAQTTITVTQATPVITWLPNPATIPYGTALSTAQLDATASTPGTFAYTPALGTVLAAGTHTLSATFTPTDTTDFTSATKTVTITVTPASSATTLAITSGGTASATVSSGSVVTLTATVTMAGQPVNPGQVNFCDATATYCTDIHLLGTAQLTAAGTATLKFIPGIGSHSYKAVFLGTADDTASSSASATLAVTGLYPTATTIAQTGSAGNYTLTATTEGTGTFSAAPTGVVSFLNQTDGNTVQATATLGTAVTNLLFVDTASQTNLNAPEARSAVADFNGDGIPDIATANSAFGKSQGAFANTLTISLGNGDGSFKTLATAPATGSGPDTIAVADFNGDGIPDLAVANANDTVATVLLGNGDGTFRAAPSPSLGTAAYHISLVAADFNGDGIADLAVSGGGDNALTLLLGNGDGTFTVKPVTLSGNMAGMVTGDFNGDGKADLAIQSYYPTDQLIVLLGNGDGTFTSAPSVTGITFGSNTNGMTIGDFNGDGKLDLAIADFYQNTVTVLLGNGDGTFVSKLAASATGVSPSDVQAADFNGDGKLDLAVANFSSNGQTILLGNGDGTFTLPAIPTGTVTLTAAAADLNGDGVPDLVATDGTASIEATLTQRSETSTAVATGVDPVGAGTFQIVASYPGDIHFKPSTSAAITLNGTQLVPTITWVPTVSTITYGTALGPQQLDAVATGANGIALPGTFTYTPAAGTVLTAGSQTLKVVFTPTSSLYSVATKSVTITVTQATPAITWVPNPATITYGTALSAAQLDATSSTPGTFVYTPALGAVLGAGTHILSATFTPTDIVDFTSVTKTATITVTRATPVITWLPNPATITYGTALSAAQLDATASTPGTFVYTPALGAVLMTGTQTLSAMFTPTNATDFTSATKTVTITVDPSGVVFTPASLQFGNQPYGTASGPQIITVTNPGTLTINISSVLSYDEPNPEDFIPTSNCITALLPGASCQISVTFLPDGVGVKGGFISISDDAYIGGQGFPVSGTGTGGILQVNPGNLKTIAGNGTPGYAGDGGPAPAAELNGPDGVAFDSSGNLYIADTFNNVIRKVDNTGKITTVAGNGTSGFMGDGGLATNAELANPFSVTLDKVGNLYIQDTGNEIVRKVDTNGIITTIAGTPDVAGHSGDGGPATMATLAINQGARFDAAGSLFVPQCSQASIRKIDTQGIITTVAGNFTTGYTGDGGPATSAQLACPSGVVIDAKGNFYIADYYNHAIRKVDTSGIITTIAGDGAPGATGDGGPATAATLNLPNDVLLDAAGDLYIADSGNNRIRKIDTNGVMTTVAGGLGSAGSAEVNTPSAVALDSSGNLYFSDTNNNAIRELYPQGTTPFPATVIGTAAAPQTLTLSNVGNVPIVIPASGAFTLSGNSSDFALSGGTCLNGATLAANDSTCTLQISFTPTAVGQRTLTVSIADNAVNSPQSFTIGGIGSAATPTLTWPSPASIVYGTPLSPAQLDAVAIGSGGAALSGTYTYTPAAGTILTAGTHTLSVVFTSADPNYTGATATVPITVTQAAPAITWLPNPAAITYGTALSAAQLDATASTPGTFVYTPALGAVLAVGTQTLNVAFTPTDAVDFTSASKSVTIDVLQSGLTLTPASLQFGNIPYGTSVTQVVTVTNPGTLAITGISVSSTAYPNPNDFVPTQNCPSSLAPDATCQISVAFVPDGVGEKSGSINVTFDSSPYYLGIPVSGTGTGGVLQVNPGNLKTIAGDGIAGYTGDGGPATAAELNQPNGVAFDPAGNFYIVDQAANVVRKVDGTGTITTFAGTGTAGYSGDGGPAVDAELNFPWTVASDKAGNIYIQDAGNNVIRKVDSKGTITTFAGTGVPGHSGDGGPAIDATFDENDGAKFDSVGNFFVPQCGYSSVRKIDTQGFITTVAGNYTSGYSGDGGPATNAQLSCPSGVAIDPAGNFYIADYFNDAIRKIDASGIITTIAGNGTPGATGDGGPATAATLNLPDDVVLDALGNLYIADTGNNRIRKIDTKGIITTVAGGLNDAGSAGVNGPLGVTIDSAGNVYFSDTNNSAVREIYPQGIAPFPDTPIGATAPVKTVTLSNIGNVPIVIPATGAFTLGGNASDFSLTGGTCLNGATLAVNAGTCTLQISFTPTAAGMRSLIVSIADNALNSPQSFTIGGNGTAVPATLTWPAPASIVYGTPLSPAQLDAAAAGLGGTPVSGTYTYTPAAGTVLTAGTHTLSVVFTSTDPNYTGATATVPITVGQAVPSVAWTPSPSTIGYGTPLSAAQLDAASNIPGSFTYTPAQGTVLSAGTQTLSAVFTPTDTIDFTSVPTTATIIVTSATPAVTWSPNPATITYGTPLSAAQLDATSTTPGSFTYTPALGTVLGAGQQSLAAVFTPADTTDFKPVTAAAAITVSRATPVLSWNTPAPIVSGTPLSAAQLNATAVGVNGLPLPGIFAYTPAAGTVLPVGTSALSVLFTPTDSIDYTTASATVVQSVTASATTTTLTSSLAQSVFGQPVTFTAVTTSNAPVTGTVNFYDGSNLLGSSSISSGSPATLTRSTLVAAHHTITAIYTGDQNFLTSTSNAVALTVSPAPTAIAWTPNPATISYGNPLTAAQLDAAASTAYTPAVPGTFTYTPALGAVLPPGPQTLQVSFTPTDTTDFLPSTGAAQITVTGGLPVITWVPAPATITYGTPLSAAQLDASSSTPGTFTYTPGLGAILGAGTQTLSVLFTPSDTVHYKSVTATVPITVTQSVPAVTWTPNPAMIAYGTALSSAQLDATSIAAGTFAYTPALGTILTAGTQTLTAVFTPTDTTDFKSVSTTATISVTAAAPTVTWMPNPATISYGTPLSAAQLDATSSTPGTFTYTPALGTVLAAGTQTLSAVFTPKDAADFKSVTTTAIVVVSPAAPVITWTPNPATITYGTALTAAQLDATSATPGTFTYTPGLGTVLTAGTQTLSATFTPNDTANFKPTTATATITVTAATPAITWTPNPATITYGTALTAAQLDASSSTPGTFSYNPALGTVLTAGSQTLSVLFTPTDSTNFKPVTATATITITAATPAVTWTPAPASITYGTALSTAQLDASSSTPGTFSYNPALGAVLSAGTQTLSVLFTPTDARNFKSVTATATITVGQAAPTITWVAPASIVVGTALSSTQLNAAATGVTGAALSGTFIYTPAAGTILTAGTQTLSVAFTAADLADYTTAAASVTLQVIPVTLTALSTNTAALGDPAKTITLTGTGFVPTASVLVNGTAIPTTFVNATTLTAVIPASDFLVAQTLQISVTEPSQNQTTASLAFLVGAPPADAVFTGPSITSSGTQTGLTFQLPEPYPVDLTSTFKLSFTPAAGLPNDPTVVFASGGTTFVATIPANSTTVPPVMIQSGTVAGTIAVGLTLEAGGINVTPASIQPLNIQAPLAVPGITSVTFTPSGNTLTVTIRGFSNSREMTSAKFHFTPATGDSIADQDVTIDVGSLFTTWYADPASIQYGSSFTYAQTFNLSSDASVVSQVSVTLANSVGVSQEAKTP